MTGRMTAAPALRHGVTIGTMEFGPPAESAEHVLRNRVAWDARVEEFAEHGRRAWQQDVTWGIWNVPETALHVLPDVGGRDVIELGCGTAYFSAWLARLGAVVTGLDNSAAQLATAQALQRENGLSFSLVQADAERLPLADASIDLAISEYGASIWCDPYRWVPEASRVLRVGGMLIFLVNGTLLMLCSPDSLEPAADRLLRPYFGMHRIEWSDEPGVEFHLGYGDWIRLLRGTGFAIENLLELRAPAGAVSRYSFVDGDWARRWPSEQIWVARKTG